MQKHNNETFINDNNMAFTSYNGAISCWSSILKWFPVIFTEVEIPLLKTEDSEEKKHSETRLLTNELIAPMVPDAIV